MRRYGDILVKDKYQYKHLIGIILEILLGFVLSSVKIFGSYPFGLAFCAVCNSFGIVGVLLNFFWKSKDIFRYLIASVGIFAVRKLVFKKIEIPNGAKVFLSALWGVLFAEIAGIFLKSYTFEENLAFALGGLCAGFFAYVFEKSRKGDGEYPPINQKLFFLCFNVSIAAFLYGVMSLGGIFVNTAFILTFFTVFCISDRFGFMRTATTCAILGLSIWLFSGQYTFFFAMLLIGGLLSSLLKDIHKYAIVAAFVIANALMVIYTRGDTASVYMLVNVTLAGTIFVMIPDRFVEKLLKYISPMEEKAHYKMKKKSPQKVYRKASALPETNDAMKAVCNGCTKRLTCWVKDYSYTADIFEKIKNCKSSYSVPEHFEKRCPYTEDLIRASRKGLDESKTFKIVTSQISIPKKGESVCGDCGGCFSTADDKYILCITDGMGTGEAAAKESIKSTKMLKKLIDHGVDKSDAIKVVNEMLLKSENELILGIDLTVIDLLTGSCESFKAGAAPTFVVRDGNAFEVGSASLPIGMLEDAEFVYNKYRLLSGDYVVMISDGLLAYDTKWITDYLREACSDPKNTCFDIVNGIAQKAKQLKIQHKDDITVLAAQCI